MRARKPDHRARIPFVFLAAFAAAVGAGCSDDDKDSDGDEPSGDASIDQMDDSASADATIDQSADSSMSDGAPPEDAGKEGASDAESSEDAEPDAWLGEDAAPDAEVPDGESPDVGSDVLAQDCFDKVKNGTETDVDCGGGVCAACKDGLHCQIAADCVTGHACDGATSTCVECTGNDNCPLGKLCNLNEKKCTIDGCIPTQHECPAPEACCQGQCKVVQTDLANCGACGNACLDVANAQEACAGGVCTYSCDAAWEDCDSSGQNGCEASLATSLLNCGACGNVCSFAHAKAKCAGGQCGILSCDTGFGNCNHLASDGCETNIVTSTLNCGACDNFCALPNANPVCANATCGILTCKTGFANCNQQVPDGCEVNITSDKSNCGTCGNHCPTRPNASATCMAATCGIACHTGYANCNVNTFDGCEVNTATNASHCGACNNACPSTQVCVSSKCQCPVGMTMCSSKCVNISTDPANCGGCGKLCKAGYTCSGGNCWPP